MNKTDRRLLLLADLPVLLVAIAVFVLLTTYQLELPGVHTDECLEVIPAVQLVGGQEVECYKDVCIEVFGQRLPVMIYEYIATVNTYLAIPFFALLGVNVTALRLMPITQSVVAMVFLYLLARELYNRRVAAMSVLLVAVSPSFVFWSRQGVFVTSVTIPISLIGVWSWLRWWRSGKRGYLFVGAFLFGLGVSAKFLFGWLLAGVGGAFVVLNADRILACIRLKSLDPLGFRLRWSDILIGGLLFVVGLSPLILFNLRTMSTINYIRDNVFGTSYWDVDNANIAVNLRERVKEFRSVLNGETFWYLSIHPYASWRYPSVFLIAVGVAAFSVFGRKGRSAREMMPTWLVVVATVVPSYVVIRLLPLHASPWHWVILAIGMIAPAVVGALTLRGRAWQDWAALIGTGLASAALMVGFCYLGWKMTQWAPSSKIYLTGILALVAAPWLRAREDGRKVLFPVLVIVGMMALSVVTPTALWFTHLAILTPWPFLAIAVIADMVARRSGLDGLHLGRISAFGRQVGVAACSLGTLAVLTLGVMLAYDDLEVDAAYHAELSIIGGKADHTHASYRLADYIKDHQMQDVIAMDFGIQDVVQFLTAGEVNPPEIFGYLDRQKPDPAFAIRVREQFERPEAVYVFRETPVFAQRWETFEAIAAEDGKTVVEETVIYDWSAIPIYRLVRVTD